MNEGYCDKCGHFTREINGKFIDGKGYYQKRVCDICGQIVKIRFKKNETNTTDEH